MINDSRNVGDEFKGMSHESIVNILDQRGAKFHVAVENLERDFNMGSIVRSANAFGVRTLHIIGRRQWNKRGAMVTDKYLHLHYHNSVDEFVSAMMNDNRQIIAVDNTAQAIDLELVIPRDKSVLVFGSEGNGISEALISQSDTVVSITQLGSTRSLNVAAAAAVVMYKWVTTLTKKS